MVLITSKRKVEISLKVELEKKKNLFSFIVFSHTIQIYYKSALYGIISDSSPSTQILWAYEELLLSSWIGSWENLADDLFAWLFA